MRNGSTFHTMPVIRTIILLSCLLIQPSAAQPMKDFQQARILVEAGEILPLNVIMLRARRRGMTGQIIDVAFRDNHGRYIYVVTVLDTKGLIHEVFFDATDGQVLEVYEEN